VDRGLVGNFPDMGIKFTRWALVSYFTARNVQCSKCPSPNLKAEQFGMQETHTYSHTKYLHRNVLAQVYVNLLGTPTSMLLYSTLVDR